MLEVRRDDGELCGYVAPQDGRWRSLTAFGGTLDHHDSEREARRHVEELGLRVLADHWTLVDGATGEEQLVCIQQVSPAEVTVAVGWYSLPGVPTVTIRAEELTSGRWRLERRS